MELGRPVRQGVRPKSPNAPAYSIQECLEDVRKIFRAEHQASISRESIAEHLSLAAQSGPFNRKLSSLRQFGLLEPIGKDLRVSDLFLRIDHAADDSDRLHALRDALGRPTIFQGLLGQYENSGIPSDLSLTNQLIIKYRFTKKNAEIVSKAFLESYRFAGLGTGRSVLPPLSPFSLHSQQFKSHNHIHLHRLPLRESCHAAMNGLSICNRLRNHLDAGKKFHSALDAAL